MVDSPPNNRRPRYDSTINLGHLLVVASMVVTATVFWLSLTYSIDQKIADNERRIAILETRMEVTLARLAVDIAEIKQDIKDLERPARRGTLDLPSGR